MRENLNFDPIRNLQERAETRGKVARSMNEAIEQVAEKYEMGEDNARHAKEAVARVLERDVATQDMEELRRIAEEAVEESFEAHGFDDPECLADIYVALDDRLKEEPR